MNEPLAEILVRDVEGNTLYRAEMPDVVYDSLHAVEAHVSDAGTLIVTVEALR